MTYEIQFQMTCEIQKRCFALFLIPSFYLNIFSLKHYGQVGGLWFYGFSSPHS